MDWVAVKYNKERWSVGGWNRLRNLKKLECEHDMIWKSIMHFKNYTFTLNWSSIDN